MATWWFPCDFFSAPGSEDEYEVPPGSAQDSSAGHSAPRSPIPPDSEQRGPASESGGSADSIAVEATAAESIEGEQEGMLGRAELD